MPNPPPGIQTLLLDADGVVQTSPSAFINDLQALCPEPSKSKAFLEDVFAAEKPCLAGGSFFPDQLAQVLRRWEIDVPLSDALALWHQIEPVPEILNTVAALRARGIRVCLATNQQVHRAGVMANHPAYAALFDDLFFSFELGAAKPSSDFFQAILDRLEIAPPNALFIDDHPKNVAAAKDIGIRAELYHVDDGIASFVSILARYGMPV